MPGERVVIIGGGLAGLTAACELLEKGCNVTIIEKNNNLGGNASKATCGIAAPGSVVQEAAGVKDDGKDLLAAYPNSAGMLKEGTKDVDWLTKSLGVDSDMLPRPAPGHAVSRVLGTKEFFPGAVVTYAAIAILEKVAKVSPERCEILNPAQVSKLCMTGGKVTGVEYKLAGKTETVQGNVVIATGGFAGNTSPSSLMAKSKLDLVKLPTTNDERADGGGITLGQAAGAATGNMDSVVIYPLSSVLEDTNLSVVLSDTLCSAGGKLFDAKGSRFCNEMASSEERSSAMMKAKAPIRLVISAKEAASVEWVCNFYKQRKVLKEFASISALEAEMKVPKSTIKGLDSSSSLYTAIVTPALYACAGGLKVAESDGKVLNAKGAAIEGLFAAGEVTCASDPKLYNLCGVPLLHSIHSGRKVGRAAACTPSAQPQPLQAILTSSFSKDIAASASQKAHAELDAKKQEEPAKKLEDMSKDELIEKVKALEAGGAVVAAAPVEDPNAPKQITMDEVKKHNKKDDAWIVLFGEVIDVTKWISVHPGGEQAITAFLGQDATEEWQMIHKPGTVEKSEKVENGPVKLGKVGSPGGGAPAAAGAKDEGGITMADVALHKTEADAWCVINGQVLDVTAWIPIHPGGVQAITSYLGQDASEEWNMIHKAGTVEKMMKVENGPKLIGPLKGGSAPPPVVGPVDDSSPPPDGDGGIPGTIGAILFLAFNFVLLVIPGQVAFTGNFKFDFTNNRKGTIKSALFLITFIIIHALGNFVDMLGGPNELNGEGYLFDRIHWTGGFGMFKSSFSVVEEYLAICFMLHIAVAFKRSWDISINYCLYTGRWNMLISGLSILFFLINHLQDFRFYEGYKMVPLRVPPYFIAWDGLLEGRVFYETDKSVEPVMVRDIYSHEVELFKDFGTVALYTALVTIFVMHMSMGWKKLVPSDLMQIPRDHQTKVKYMGWVAAAAVAGMYLSVPWYVYFVTPEKVIPA